MSVLAHKPAAPPPRPAPPPECSASASQHRAATKNPTPASLDEPPTLELQHELLLILNRKLRFFTLCSIRMRSSASTLKHIVRVGPPSRHLTDAFNAVCLALQCLTCSRGIRRVRAF